jgi:hypothetical protein
MFLAGAVVSLLAIVATVAEPHPTADPELLRTAAGIGASFFIAYVIEAAWLVVRIAPEGPSGELAAGVLTGFALWGVFGVVVLLFLSAGLTRGAPISPAYWFWWSCLALTLLGLAVAVQPAMTHLSRSLGDD